MAITNGGGFSTATALQGILPFTRRTCTSPRLFQLQAQQRQPPWAQCSITRRPAHCVASGLRGLAYAAAEVRPDVSEEDSGPSTSSNNSMDDLLETAGVANIKEDQSPVPLRSTRKTDIHDIGPQDRAEIGDQVRQAMRAVPNSVVIITSTDIRGGRTKYRGAAVSSFNTVTIEPTTIVSVNIKRPSATWDAILSSEYFLVHLLNATESAGTIASAFTKGVTSTPFNDLYQFKLEANAVHLPMKDAHRPRARPPMLSAQKDLNRSFAERLLCRGLMDKTVEVSDHVVIFGIVERVIPAPSIGRQTQRSGLAYVNGQYGQITNLTNEHAPDSDEPLAHTYASIIIKPKRRPKRKVRMALDPQQEVMTDDVSAGFSKFLWKIQIMDHSTLVNVETMSHFAKKLDPPTYQSWSELVAVGFKTLKTLTTQWRSLWQKLQQTGRSHQPPSAAAALVQRVSIYWCIFPFTNDLKLGSVDGLREETIDLLESYRNQLIDVHRQVTSLERVLQTLYDSTAMEQPPVHPLYDIRKAPAEKLADRYLYLRSYLIYCLDRPIALDRNVNERMSSLHLRIAASLIAYYDSVKHTITWISEQARTLSLSSKDTTEQAISRLREIANDDILLVPRSSELIQKYGHSALIRVYFPALRRTTENSLAGYGRTCEETFRTLVDHWDLVSDPYQKLGLEVNPETILEIGDGLRAGPIRKVATTVYQTLVRTTPGPKDPNYPVGEELDLRKKTRVKDPFARKERKGEEREQSIESELENIRVVMQQEKTKINGPSAKRSHVKEDVEQSIGDALEDVRRLMQQEKTRL